MIIPDYEYWILEGLSTIGLLFILIFGKIIIERKIYGEKKILEAVIQRNQYRLDRLNDNSDPNVCEFCSYRLTGKDKLKWLFSFDIVRACPKCFQIPVPKRLRDKQGIY